MLDVAKLFEYQDAELSAVHLIKGQLMRALFLVLPFFVAACDTLYTSPAVDANNELVEVVDVTAATLSQINSVPYRPKSLPKEFQSTAQKDLLINASAVLPEPVEELPDLPAEIETSVPPRLQNGPYKIGVSDVLLLATPAPTTTEELTGLVAAQNKRQGYTVQDDGAIAVPDVGRIEVAGMTLEEAENAVFNALVDRQIDPKFSLEVAEFKSQSVSVAGSVNAPTLAPITIKPLKLQDALQLAGGLNVADDENAVIRINRGDQLYQIPLKEMRAKPRLQDIHLTHGDRVFVDEDYRIEQARAFAREQLALTQARTAARAQALSEVQVKNTARATAAEEARQNFLKKLELGAIKRDHVFLAGEVAQQGRFPLPFENVASVADALYSQNGISTQNGDPGEIYLLRMNRDATFIRAYHVDGSEAVNLLLLTRMELRPDDVVFVSEQPVTAWNRVVSQLLPTATIASQVDN